MALIRIQSTAENRIFPMSNTTVEKRDSIGKALRWRSRVRSSWPIFGFTEGAANASPQFSSSPGANGLVSIPSAQARARCKGSPCGSSHRWWLRHRTAPFLSPVTLGAAAGAAHADGLGGSVAPPRSICWLDEVPNGDPTCSAPHAA